MTATAALTAKMASRFTTASGVADAVLYEGYILYPYRASSQKNRSRWQFGVLMPPAYVAADSSETTTARAECVFTRDGEPSVSVIGAQPKGAIERTLGISA